MVKEALVRTDLTENMIKAGENLIKRLDKDKFIIRAAYWNLFSETSIWKLIIVSPESRNIGPRKTYKKIQNALNRIATDGEKLTLDDISLSDPDDPFVTNLKRVIATPTKDIVHARFKNCSFGGFSVSDILIYRIS